ncbi:hypothetical protein [uncultured Nocardioides sp.]|uniref:hypothetical protein n=1 Tax=uncultured Nocardioides sp. TaxID=198441 RepID=UPI002621F414|nr:hypothetical protein [uncultured Nocardioides sp.]
MLSIQPVDLRADRALERRDGLALGLLGLGVVLLEIAVERCAFGADLLQPLAVRDGVLEGRDRDLDEQEAEEHRQDDREEQTHLPQGEAEDSRDQTHRAILVRRHGRPGPVLLSSATHSTWWVIGKTPMLLSVSAILCRQLRSSGQTGL